jgi:hypothetical protein
MQKIAVIAMSLLLTVWIMSGCGRPERKKMPAFSSFDGGFESPGSSGALPFYVTDTDIYINGHSADFLCIAMPSPIFDSLAWSMVTTYSQVALPMFNQLAQEGRKGVVVDLRSTGNNSHRTDLSIMNNGSNTLFSLPVVILWDANASARASSFFIATQSLPAFKCIFMGGDPPLSAGRFGTADCFQFSKPVIGQ